MAERSEKRHPETFVSNAKRFMAKAQEETKVFTINLPYQTEAEKVKSDTKLSNSELTLDYLTYAVNQKYPNGLEGQLRRIWGRIQRTLDQAIEANDDGVVLETAEKEFILKAFKDVKFPAKIAKFVIMLEDEIDKFTTN